MSFRCRVAASLLVLVVAGCGPSTSSAASGATVDQSSGRGASGRPAAGENAGSTGVGLPTATSAAGVTATSVPAAPSDFYDIPQPLPPGPAGSIVWAQRVAAPVGAVAWRVLYHSTSVSGGDVAVSGLVVAPDSPPRIGGFPVLAYAHGSTGLADACAPSKDARAIEPTATASSSIGDLPVPSELWTPGYVVAATDYEGLGTSSRASAPRATRSCTADIPRRTTRGSRRQLRRTSWRGSRRVSPGRRGPQPGAALTDRERGASARPASLRAPPVGCSDPLGGDR